MQGFLDAFGIVQICFDEYRNIFHGRKIAPESNTSSWDMLGQDLGREKQQNYYVASFGTRLVYGKVKPENFVRRALRVACCQFTILADWGVELAHSAQV